MCPDITLYDFRVVGTTLEGTEFAIIAALQFIRCQPRCRGKASAHGARQGSRIERLACAFAKLANEGTTASRSPSSS
jgi:hypothetical protein